MTVGSLFSGSGGLDLGLEWAGIEMGTIELLIGGIFWVLSLYWTETRHKKKVIRLEEQREARLKVIGRYQRNESNYVGAVEEMTAEITRLEDRLSESVPPEVVERRCQRAFSEGYGTALREVHDGAKILTNETPLSNGEIRVEYYTNRL